MLDPWSSQLGSTIDHPKKTHKNDQDLAELPLEFGSITCAGIIGPYNSFGSICEWRGLSNLKTLMIKTILAYG